MNRYYTYVYQDPRKPGPYFYMVKGKFYVFSCEPFYIGVGKRDRYRWSNTRNRKYRMRSCRICNDGYRPKSKRFFFLSYNEAEELEKELIKVIGRKDLGLGPLVNLTNGGYGLSGYIYTEEHRKKISEAKKGHPGYYLGKHLSEETKRKLSEAHKGRAKSEETRRKISESLKGKKPSEETVRKIVESRKWYIHSEETRRKISAAKMGHVVTLETRRKLSENHSGWWVGKKHSLETRKKMSESGKLAWRKRYACI